MRFITFVLRFRHSSLIYLFKAFNTIGEREKLIILSNFIKVFFTKAFPLSICLTFVLLVLLDHKVTKVSCVSLVLGRAQRLTRVEEHVFHVKLVILFCILEIFELKRNLEIELHILWLLYYWLGVNIRYRYLCRNVRLLSRRNHSLHIRPIDSTNHYSLISTSLLPHHHRHLLRHPLCTHICLSIWRTTVEVGRLNSWRMWWRHKGEGGRAAMKEGALLGRSPNWEGHDRICWMDKCAWRKG